MIKYRNLREVFKMYVSTLKNDIQLGLNICLLPNSVNKLYNSYIIRFIRIMGGISIILYLTELYKYLNEYLICIVLILSIIQVVQILLVSILKVIFGLYVLRSDQYYLLYSVRKIIVLIVLGLRISVVFIMEVFGLCLLGTGLSDQIIEILVNLIEIKKSLQSKYKKVNLVLKTSFFVFIKYLIYI